jgi:ferredoxin-NADP reductase/MOSC domain-containing protein YiiM
LNLSKVLSVNVGLPRDVEWQGRTVRTAIWKQPVEGRVAVRRLNLDGDRQADLAGHGGEYRALMVYQLESYQYWQGQLGRSDFVCGQFGENLTVDGLADAEVCIGDRFRIGSAIFEVTQPRVTCYRLGIRMKHPQMPALVVSHRRPGFYLRVLREGDIGKGDKIVKIAAGPEPVTVAELSALLYLPGHSADKLQRALRIPSLSPGWRHSLEGLLAADSNGHPTGNAGLSSAQPVSWRGFRRMKIAASTQESEDVRSFVLTAEDGSRLPDALAGQHIAVKLVPQAGAPPVIRNYSLSGPTSAGSYRISVKREARGIASSYLHAQVKTGAILETSAPRGTFTLLDGTRPVILLSAGVGVTPMLAMLHTEAEAKTTRDVWWIHGARDGLHHSFPGEVRSLVQSLKSGHSAVVYSRPAAGDQLGRNYDAEGRVDVPLLKRLGVPQDSDFYLCGPANFLDELTAALKQWGVAASRIHAEIFGASQARTPGIATADQPSAHLPAGEAGTGPTVTFTRSGLTVPWHERFQNLLELAEACDVPVRWACRTGVCHTCECPLIDGDVSYSPDPLDQPIEGNALICCSTPTSNIQLDL